MRPFKGEFPSRPKMNIWEQRELAEEKARADLKAVLLKYKGNLKKVEAERQKTGENKQAEATASMAIDILEDEVIEIIKRLVNLIGKDKEEISL